MKKNIEAQLKAAMSDGRQMQISRSSIGGIFDFWVCSWAGNPCHQGEGHTLDAAIAALLKKSTTPATSSR